MDEHPRFETDDGHEEDPRWASLTPAQRDASVARCMSRLLTLLKLYQWCPRAGCRRARACASRTLDKACINANRDVVAPQLSLILKDIARRMREQDRAKPPPRR